MKIALRVMVLGTLVLAAALAATPARAQNQPASAATEAPELEYEMAEVTEPPELANRDAVARLLRANYPREYRNRGESGTVMVRMLVRSDGAVDSARVTMVKTTHADLVEPAATVARGMRFKPATVDGHPISVWIMLPISFMRER